MRLDQRDFEILRVLSREGRITKAALAEKVGLSPTPCWERLARLEKAGIIEGYRAEVNLRKLGPSVTVFMVVELSDHTAAAFRTFEAAIQKKPEVVGCWALGGGFDYLLEVISSDVEAYQALVDAMLDARIGVSRYYSYIVTKRVKSGTLPPFALFER
jgi:Lrp/AsnC family transcriptional regulator of ectoine degradation